MTKLVKIVVNGREIEADASKPLIHACHAHDVEVPHYCYHPGLSPVGSCRICQVEVKQGETPARVVVACRTPVAEGMVVDTESPKAHAVRRECLEFLLKNHPLDCPICDKAGECDLQDYTYSEGQAEGRSREPRRQLEKRRRLGDVIVLDEERCILCSRCVRFFEEVTQKPQLTVANLGSRSVIDTFAGRPLTGNYQGNIADLCPVGALTLEPFRFQARVWNLLKVASTCAECSRGCSTTVEVLRHGDVKRFRPRPNPDVNRYWMCDVGRFAFGHVNAPGRLAGAVVRGAHGLESVPVDDALERVRDALATRPGAVLLVSPFLTVEEGRLVLELGRTLDAAPRFVSPPPNGLADDLLHTGDPCPNRRGLSELGLAPITPAEALAELARGPAAPLSAAGAALLPAAGAALLPAAGAALLIGERMSELLGVAGLAALPPTLPLCVLDTHALDVPAARVCIGVPNVVERTGTFVNVDGFVGPIAAAKPAPAGVAPLTATLARLTALLQAAEVASG